MKMFRDLDEKDLVPDIEEVIKQGTTPTLYPEDPIHVHVIPDERESAKNNESINPSGLT